MEIQKWATPKIERNRRNLKRNMKMYSVRKKSNIYPFFEIFKKIIRRVGVVFFRFVIKREVTWIFFGPWSLKLWPLYSKSKSGKSEKSRIIGIDFFQNFQNSEIMARNDESTTTVFCRIFLVRGEGGKELENTSLVKIL